jgi:isoquinoline 1-oxidoreductase beta subunit
MFIAPSVSTKLHQRTTVRKGPARPLSQLQSAIMFGITAALHGKITLKNGRVEQANFDTYEILRINEAPAVEVHIVQSSQPPGGMGEAGTSAIVPAVANAIFAAMGKRLRKLPVDTAALKQLWPW